MSKETVLVLRWAAVDGNGEGWFYTHRPTFHASPDGGYWDTTADGDDYGIPAGEVTLADGVSAEDTLIELPFSLKLTIQTDD